MHLFLFSFVVSLRFVFNGAESRHYCRYRACSYHWTVNELLYIQYILYDGNCIYSANCIEEEVYTVDSSHIRRDSLFKYCIYVVRMTVPLWLTLPSLPYPTPPYIYTFTPPDPPSLPLYSVPYTVYIPPLRDTLQEFPYSSMPLLKVNIYTSHFDFALFTMRASVRVGTSLNAKRVSTPTALSPK